MLFDSQLRAEHRAFAAQDAARRTERAREARAAMATRGTVEIEYLPFGPADASGAPTCEVVAAYAEVELEYAAIRNGVALVDCPQRTTVAVRGKDRVDFVNRLLTQEIGKLPDAGVTRAFLTNRKGRIEADLVVCKIGELLLLDTLVHDGVGVQSALEKLLFSEEVVIASRQETHARLALHGPKAEAALRAVDLASPNACDEAWSAPLGSAHAECWRVNELGVAGVELSIPLAHAATIWRSLTTFGARPAGWFAVNTARVEAGTPYFRIDFGPTNLPQESGVLASRVSFTKGCYPGQEVVARLQHLGKPKQKLVGLRIEEDLLPVADAQVFAKLNTEGAESRFGDQVGVVTSSALAPMLGAVPVAFAMIASSSYADGTTVLVNAEGAQATATVGSLSFLASSDAADSQSQRGGSS